MISRIEIVGLHGAGRTFVILFEQDSHYFSNAESLFKQLSSDQSPNSGKILFISVPIITIENWSSVTEELQKVLGDQKVRQASFISFGDAGALSQNLYLKNPKIVRSLLIIDGASSPHPTWWETFIDRLEACFPLGLPLRGESRNFNARSHLQRIRCPVLRVSTDKASHFLKAESAAASEAMPTAWCCDLPSDYPVQDESAVLSAIVTHFQEIPAKCPQ